MSEPTEEAIRVFAKMLASGTAHGFPHGGDPLPGEPLPRPDDPAAYHYCPDCDVLVPDIVPVLRAFQVATALRCAEIADGRDGPGARLTWLQIRERIRSEFGPQAEGEGQK